MDCRQDLRLPKDRHANPVASHKHRHGSGFNVHISLTVPPHESVIVNHDPSDDKRYAHEHIEEAVKDAFAAARRQLDDLA